MLYSMIPPILVVLSLVGIIIFLMKKASKIAMLEDRGASEYSEVRGVKGFFKGTISRAKGSGFKQGIPAFFGKISGGFRSVFSGLGNKFGGWREFARKRKEEKKRTREKMVLENTDDGLDQYEDGIMERVASYNLEKKDGEPEMFQRRTLGRKPVAEEKPVRPTISEKIVAPRKKRESQERFEELLIERIAANPRDTEAYERLGEYYFEMENLDHAKECFKQVAKLDPMNRSVKYKLKKLERMLGR